MTYEEKYKELVELSHSDIPEIKEKADAWLMSIGLQGAAELRVSEFLLDLAIKNVKGEMTRDEVSQRIKEHYGNQEYREPRSGLYGDYEIIPLDSSKIKEIEEYNRKLRPQLYTELDKKRTREELLSENSSDKLIFVNIKESYEALQHHDRKHPLFRSSLYDCTRMYWQINKEKFNVATHILGCYKDKRHKEWIDTNGLYNIRLGRRNGSIDKSGLMLADSRLLLYNKDNPSEYKVYQLDVTKQVLASPQTMLDKGYPGAKGNRNYILYFLGTEVNDHPVYDPTKLRQSFAPGTTNNAPFFVEL